MTPIPAKIGRYEIKAELGRGGMAAVYRAYDPSFDREVAIKVLPREFLHDPNFTVRFKSEIKTVAALEHPAIVPVYDAGEDDGIPYFVMRYMTGGSLTNQLERGKFSIQDAARIIERLASALAYAHRKGVVHRDLKPDNILFDSIGDPYISDFGIASIAASPSNLTGNAAIGTPAYMSPEQAQGDKVDNRSDIYGLGVIIFQMLSGKPPYNADSPMAVAVKHITDPVPEILKVNPTLPEATDTVIKTAMAKKREDRYPSATDLSRAFQEVAFPDKGSTSSGKSGLFGLNRGLIFGGIAVMGVAVLAVAFLAVLFLRNRAAPAAQPAPTDIAAPTEVTVNPETQPPAAASDFFTEDFDGSPDNWANFITSGQQTELDMSVADGSLLFDLQGKELRAYSYYTPRTYDNIQIDIHAENRTENVSSVIMVCRYNEDLGWYEFNVSSNGLYNIYYGNWNNNKQGASYVRIANGASNEINQGAQANDYSARCEDRTLSLSANGSEVRTVVDNRFVLKEGYVGLGAESLQRVPTQIRIDSFAVSQP